MTEEEKQRDRQCKVDVTARLSCIDIRRYKLGSIDKRLTTYAKTVISHPEGHNLYEQLALLRFFHLLDKYEMRAGEVKKFIRFYESLPFSGTNGRQCYKLTPVQVFQFTNIMGFYRDSTHHLCHDALLFVPRKFSKTTSVASLAIYDFLFGDHNAQAFTTANSFNQAQICFKEIKSILEAIDPNLSHFRLNREIVKWKDNSFRESSIQCLAANADKLDGLNASMVISDEYANADSSDVREKLITSMGMRENPLVVTITTASSKTNTPFFDMLELYKKILRGDMQQDAIFAHIFQPDVDDEEGDPKTWAKVQPHLGITVRKEYYSERWTAAQSSIDDMRGFRNLQLNVFDTEGAASWITGKEIRAHSEKVSIPHFVGNPDCEVAVDLSVRDDFSAVSYYVYLGNDRSCIYSDYYIPAETVENHRNKDMYKRWVAAGYLHVCGEKTIDYEQIVADIMTNGAYLNILKIAFDPNRSQTFQNTLIAVGGGSYMRAYKQTNFYFTRPVEVVEELIYNNKLVFDTNPINAYCFDNAVLDVDRMGNKKPMKRSDNLKIDGCITALMAVGASIEQERSAV